MKKTLALVTLPFLAWFAGGCASTHEPTAQVVTQKMVANPGIGFRGYELPVVPGYSVINRDLAGQSPMFQSWLDDADALFERIRMDPMLSDDVFFINVLSGNRYLQFSVEQIYAPYPLNRLAPDQRRRLMRAADSNYADRLQVRAGIELDTGTFEQIEGKDVLWRVFQGDSRDVYAFVVLGNLNEIYHLGGVAYEGEGPELAEDIRAFIRGLRF